MENWQESIEAFDEELENRMVIVRRHELTGYDFDVLLSVMLERLLGFVDRKHFPYWRSKDAAWAIRNRERKTEAWYRRRKGAYRLQVNAQSRRRYRERMIERKHLFETWTGSSSPPLQRKKEEAVGSVESDPATLQAGDSLRPRPRACESGNRHRTAGR
jgi:hypothetical protein